MCSNNTVQLTLTLRRRIKQTVPLSHICGIQATQGIFAAQCAIHLPSAHSASISSVLYAAQNTYIIIPATLAALIGRYRA